jgi:chromosome segregation ATPase
MKQSYLPIALLAAAALLAGCDRPEKPIADTHDATAKQLEKVRTDTKAVAQDMMDYAYAQKAEFLAKMQAQLDESNRQLDQLAGTIEKSNDAAKAEAKPKIQALRDQLASLNKQLDEAKNTNESAWSEFKAGFKKGYNELKEGFQQARQWVSEKIAP